jgi:hypothetical protein
VRVNRIHPIQNPKRGEPWCGLAIHPWILDFGESKELIPTLKWEIVPRSMKSLVADTSEARV